MFHASYNLTLSYSIVLLFLTILMVANLIGFAKRQYVLMKGHAKNIKPKAFSPSK